MKKYIIGFILGAITFGSIGTVVALNYNAKDVSYNPNDENWNVNNVEDAIKDLKDIKTNREKGVEVARLTTQGASYTFENDGYISGNVASSASGSRRFGGEVKYTENGESKLVCYAEYSVTLNLYCEKICKKGTTINTRQDGGVYDLTVYEWK